MTKVAWNKGLKTGLKNKTSFKKGTTPWNKGKKMNKPPWNKGMKGLPARHTTPHSENTKKKCSEAQKKRWASGVYKSKIGFKHSEESKEKISKHLKKGEYIICIVCRNNFFCSPSTIKRGRKYCSNKCQGEYMSCENHPQWMGGITNIKEKIRKSNKYKNWRRTVFVRDEFTCQKCGEKNIYIHAHHIKPFSKFPNLSLDIDNGVTLCISCHKEVHKNKDRRWLKFL